MPETITLLHEDFNNINDTVQYNEGWDVTGGEIESDGGDDGYLLFNSVDASGLQNTQLSFDAYLANGYWEGSGHYKDTFRIDLLDAHGNFIMTLDEFTGNGYELLSSATGNTIDYHNSTLTYDIPEGIDGFQIRFFTEISAGGEDLRIDDVRITAEHPDAGSISGRYFCDEDRDSIEDASDDGIANAVVWLCDPNGEWVIQQTVTDSNGNYSFTDVPEGDYIVIFQIQEGADFVTPNVGDEASDSDIVRISDYGNYRSETIHLTAGENRSDVDGGIFKGPVVDAVDDFIVVDADETSGDTETLEGGAITILANDTEDGEAFQGVVTAVNGNADFEGMVFTGSNGGQATINSDGTIDFDSNGEFDDLMVGETRTTTFTYEIESVQTRALSYNIAIVIDVSNSTVGLEGENVFDGTGVGDVNNDGRGDTVLDAQIVAAKALVEDLRSQNIDPANVNIGIITFSGVDTTGATSYNDATVDSELVGTFNLGDSSIEATLDEVLSGSWTNYEAGLQTAESWFDANGSLADRNAMFFLSDGRPITSFENGAYVEQGTSQFLDEVARIEQNYGTEVYAFGVGANASMDNLDLIATSGTAVQVTDVASLTASLLEPEVVTRITDTATITVTVQGQETALVANPDVYQTTEDQAISRNILANDINPDPDMNEITVADVRLTGIVNGTIGEAFEITTVNGRNGLVTVTENGILTFDPNNGFEDMATDELDSFVLDYTATDGIDTDASTVTINIIGINDLADDPEFTTVDQGSGVTQLTNVLLNTYDPEAGDPTVFGFNGGIGNQGTPAAGSTGGIFVINEDGSATFDTNGDFADLRLGETRDTVVTYKVIDAAEEFVFSSYTVTVVGLNRPPEANPDLLTTDENTPETINILENDSDPDGTPVTVKEIQGGTIGEAFSVTTADGRTGTVTVQADGTLLFDPAGGFEDLGVGDTDTFDLTYTITDGELCDDSIVTVVVNGLNDLADGDEFTEVQEGSGVNTLDNVLANTVDPEAGDPMVARVDGSMMNIGGQIAGSAGGLFTINMDGTASFDTNGQFGDLNVGENRLTSVTYEVVDAAGDMVTSTYTVSVKGIGDPNETVNVTGDIRTVFPVATAIAVVFDVSATATDTFLGLTTFDLNGDFSSGTAFDYALYKLATFASTLEDDQRLGLISQSAADGSAVTQTVLAGDIKAALTTGDTSLGIDADDAAALSNIFSSLNAQTFLAEIDLADTLAEAETFLLGEGGDNNEVLVLTTSDGATGINGNGNGEPRWVGDNPQSVVARLSNPADPATTDINVVQIQPGQFVPTSPLEQIDNENGVTVVDSFNNPGSENIALADLVDVPSGLVVGDVLQIIVDGDSSGVITPTATGASFQLDDLEIVPGTQPQVNVLVDTDGSGDISAGDTDYDVTALGLLQRDGNTFSFTLDALSVG